jgi:hypothetical protein
MLTSWLRSISKQAGILRKTKIINSILFQGINRTNWRSRIGTLRKFRWRCCSCTLARNSLWICRWKRSVRDAVSQKSLYYRARLGKICIIDQTKPDVSSIPLSPPSQNIEASPSEKVKVPVLYGRPYSYSPQLKSRNLRFVWTCVLLRAERKPRPRFSCRATCSSISKSRSRRRRNVDMTGKGLLLIIVVQKTEGILFVCGMLYRSKLK